MASHLRAMRRATRAVGCSISVRRTFSISSVRRRSKEPASPAGQPAALAEHDSLEESLDASSAPNASPSPHKTYSSDSATETSDARPPEELRKLLHEQIGTEVYEVDHAEPLTRQLRDKLARVHATQTVLNARRRNDIPAALAALKAVNGGGIGISIKATNQSVSQLTNAARRESTQQGELAGDAAVVAAAQLLQWQLQRPFPNQTTSLVVSGIMSALRSHIGVTDRASLLASIVPLLHQPFTGHAYTNVSPALHKLYRADDHTAAVNSLVSDEIFLYWIKRPEQYEELFAEICNARYHDRLVVSAADLRQFLQHLQSRGLSISNKVIIDYITSVKNNLELRQPSERELIDEVQLSQHKQDAVKQLRELEKLFDQFHCISNITVWRAVLDAYASPVLREAVAPEDVRRLVAKILEVDKVDVGAACSILRATYNSIEEAREAVAVLATKPTAWTLLVQALWRKILHERGFAEEARNLKASARHKPVESVSADLSSDLQSVQRTQVERPVSSSDAQHVTLAEQTQASSVAP